MKERVMAISDGWFGDLIEDCHGILTEGVFASRWELLKTYHELGKRIKQNWGEFDRQKIYGEGLCNAIAQSLGAKSRLIYYCLQFVEKYPDIEALPEGKNCSWTKIVNKYLPVHKDDKKKPLLEDRIAQFLEELYSHDHRKEFIKEVIIDWENWK